MPDSARKHNCSETAARSGCPYRRPVAPKDGKRSQCGQEWVLKANVGFAIS